MFKEALQEVVDGTEGAFAALLMGYDGIPLEQYVREDRPMNVENLGIEYTMVLKSVMNAARNLGSGSTNEVAIRAERLTTVIRLLNDEFFLAVALSPNGNSGKARYLMRVRAGSLREALE
ncbi:MAG: hypothetical protein KC543_06885 [Myxococcales bacterium]|nr:hypothetical protein [Myxococcales bacterium]